MKKKDLLFINEKINYLRMKRCMSQVELAEKMGIKQPALSRKFNTCTWQLTDLVKISEILDCELKISFQTEDEEV